MHNEFTAVIERDGKWFIAYCPEVPGANGQGRTKEQAKRSLAEAIALILKDRRVMVFVQYHARRSGKQSSLSEA
jgi:predicted RNase H-like HicB family nuclease